MKPYGLFVAICGRVFALQSRLVRLWALRRVRCDARDFLQRHRCAIAIGVYASFMVGARCEESFSLRLQEKEKARSDERA